MECLPSQRIEHSYSKHDQNSSNLSFVWWNRETLAEFSDRFRGTNFRREQETSWIKLVDVRDEYVPNNFQLYWKSSLHISRPV